MPLNVGPSSRRNAVTLRNTSMIKTATLVVAAAHSQRLCGRPVSSRSHPRTSLALPDGCDCLLVGRRQRRGSFPVRGSPRSPGRSAPRTEPRRSLRRPACSCPDSRPGSRQQRLNWVPMQWARISPGIVARVTLPQHGQVRACPWYSVISAATTGNSATWCRTGGGSCSPASGGSGVWQCSHSVGTYRTVCVIRSAGSKSLRCGGCPGCPPGFLPVGFFAGP